MCTALEYEAVEPNAETMAFWDLVESRYIAYAFGPTAPMREVLQSALRLTPRLSSEYPAIAGFRDLVRQHPFPFMPFHRFTSDDVTQVLAHAEGRIAEYRDDVWDTRRVRAARWVRRKLAGTT